MISAFFRTCAKLLDEDIAIDGLPDDHPIIRFFSKGGETLGNYRELDDTVVWGALHAVASSGKGHLRQLAIRILVRDLPKCLDIQSEFPTDQEMQRRLKHRLDKTFAEKIGGTVLFDTATLSIYGEIGADDSRAQKRLMILGKDDVPREITTLPHAMVTGSERQRPFERYYFLNEDEYNEALKSVDSVAGRPK